MRNPELPSPARLPPLTQSYGSRVREPPARIATSRLQGSAPQRITVEHIGEIMVVPTCADSVSEGNNRCQPHIGLGKFTLDLKHFALRPLEEGSR